MLMQLSGFWLRSISQISKTEAYLSWMVPLWGGLLRSEVEGCDPTTWLKHLRAQEVVCLDSRRQIKAHAVAFDDFREPVEEAVSVFPYPFNPAPLYACVFRPTPNICVDVPVSSSLSGSLSFPPTSRTGVAPFPDNVVIFLIEMTCLNCHFFKFNILFKHWNLIL